MNLLKEDWICLYQGLGDTINQILYLESHIKYSYGIICPTRNLDFIKFIFDLFFENKKIKFNGNIIIYENDYGHAFPMEHQIIYLHEEKVKIDINECSKNNRIKNIHTWPNFWHKYIDSNILDGFYKKLSNNKSREKKILFFTERSDNFQLLENSWNDLAEKTKNLGYKNFTNRTNKNQTYVKEIEINNSESIFFSFKELFECVNNSEIVLMGQRSGIFDFLKFFPNKKIMLYTEQPDWLYPFGNLKEDSFAKNAYDIKIPCSLDDILKYL